MISCHLIESGFLYKGITALVNNDSIINGDSPVPVRRMKVTMLQCNYDTRQCCTHHVCPVILLLITAPGLPGAVGGGAGGSYGHTYGDLGYGRRGFVCVPGWGSVVVVLHQTHGVSEGMVARECLSLFILTVANVFRSVRSFL